jgi:thioglycine synthase
VVDLTSSSAQLALKTTKKQAWSHELSTRAKSVNYTLAKVSPLCKRIGVTRLSDITYMDRLYIPNYSVVLPGTEDVFWVYSGKGTTKLSAKASALMEAIERYSSLRSRFDKTFIRGNYSELSKSYDKVLHPDEVLEPVKEDYSDKDVMDFVKGFDLLTNEEVLVPAEIALYRYSPKDPAGSVFLCSHTNGLASGNVMEEAICHALCEVIERDAVSIADLSSSSIPYSIIENIINSLRKSSIYYSIRSPAQDKFVDDSIFADVDISQIEDEFEPLKFLIKKFTDANIPLLIKDITQQDIGIPTFVVSSIEWLTNDYGYFAKGFGAHPDARIALVRAITEASQTRAVNIHGARDDLNKITYKENDEIYKRKWQFMPKSSYRLGKSNNTNKKIVQFSEINTYENEDILDDIHLILRRLKKVGLKRAVIVNLTNANIGIPVVRAIVPGLETFEITKSVMGRRAKHYFRNLFHLSY